MDAPVAVSSRTLLLGLLVVSVAQARPPEAIEAEIRRVETEIERTEAERVDAFEARADAKAAVEARHAGQEMPESVSQEMIRLDTELARRDEEVMRAQEKRRDRLAALQDELREAQAALLEPAEPRSVEPPPLAPRRLEPPPPAVRPEASRTPVPSPSWSALPPAAMPQTRRKPGGGAWILAVLAAVVLLAGALVLGMALAAHDRTRKRRKCPDCAELVAWDALACRYCGKRMERPGPTGRDDGEELRDRERECPACGKSIQPEARVCRHCKSRIDVDV